VVQLVLGLCIPPLLANHLTSTRIAFAEFGLNKGYAQVLYSFWVASPFFGRVQLMLLVVAWLHGCYGIYFWLRLKTWFEACRSVLLTVYLLLVCTALGSAQSRKRGQQEPRGLTGIPNTPPASPNERRVALVIGNAAYQYTAPLQNPLNDAQDMARVLKDLQFQVILKTNATLDTMADAIFEFGERLKGGGVGLLYYSGHGMQVKGENYLIPVDANVVREDDIKRKTINARDILDKMDEAKSHLNLVFLDACRNNPFPPQCARRVAGPGGHERPDWYVAGLCHESGQCGCRRHRPERGLHEASAAIHHPAWPGSGHAATPGTHRGERRDGRPASAVGERVD